MLSPVYTTNTNCISITLQIEQTEMSNGNTAISQKLPYIVFLGNSKKEYCKTTGFPYH